MMAIYASLIVAMLGWAPIELLAPVIVVCYLRGALLTHELMHVCRPEQVAWPLRMMMLFFAVCFAAAFLVNRPVLDRIVIILSAPPIACTTRETTSRLKLLDSAQNSEPRVNSAMATKNTRREPKRSASQPEAGINSATVSM